jgi:acetyltransferase-like isoleucine patch superfamily enzyme
MSLKSDLFDQLRWFKRKFYIKWYGFRNVHPRFMATSRLKRVSKDISAGAYSYIGPNSIIYPRVSIGNYTMIANDVCILGGDHNFRHSGIPMVFAGRDKLLDTKIGSDVWIGAKSIIITGVKIGNGAIVAAGSVVTKDVEPYAIVAGVPAKLVKFRFTAEEIREHEQMLSKPVSEMNYLKYRLCQGSQMCK